MGSYVYKLVNKPKQVFYPEHGGRISVYPSAYVFKPSMYGDQSKLHERLCGPTWRAWAKRPAGCILFTIGAVQAGEGVYLSSPARSGTFYDDADHEYIGTLYVLNGILQIVTRERFAAIEKTLRENSAFKTMGECTHALGNYRPSINTATPGLLEVADLYDSIQAARGDARRAFRFHNAAAA